jgi:hypothetical protein
MSSRFSENILISGLPAAMASLLAVDQDQIQVEMGARGDVDAVVKAAGQTFAVELTEAASAGPVAVHAERAANAAKTVRKRAIPLVAVPYMGPSGKDACKRAGVSWLDFSGNAHIIAPGIRIIVDGRPNQFPKRGRPSSAFAPKSSRIARWLLMHPANPMAQREISQATDVSEGLVSRVISRLAEEHYVVRDDSGQVRVSNPQLLLDAWQEEYRFSRHTIIQGHVAARSGDALTRFVADALSAAKVEHAATGLSAAWQLTRFAGFRTTTFFVQAEPSATLGSELGFREGARGANFWLVVPNDAGVFQGADERDGVRCVHPVQAYLDLKEHPERAADATERIRAQFLSW